MAEYYDDIPNALPEDSLLNSLFEDYFNYKYFKNKIQRNAIVAILKREFDVIVSLTKGHGRTTCFQLPIVICPQKVSIVVVGVSSRIEKQMSRLNRRHVHAEKIHAGMSSEEYDDIKSTINDLSNIRSTLNSILYVTPDVVLTANFYNLLRHLNNSNSLGYIVVDLSYCENDWSRGITKRFVNTIKSTLRLRTRRADIPKDAIPWFSMDIEGDDRQM
eukprot:XP_016657696.1 PREDICTED: ATP-dependent DNA helicase Q5-like [Acyrthosiphon pisum]